ncbi:MAG: hypothetical protein ACRDK5_10970 [Solirubrobacterales bacterium]
MRVDTKLVREHLVGRILGAAIERLDELPERARNELEGALRRVTGEDEDRAPAAMELADRLALVGYACRTVEVELFEPARQPIAWLRGELGDNADDAVGMASELARAEPERRPDPGEAPSWRIPGPGGHVRHYLALDSIHQLAPDENGKPGPPPGVTALELKRCWMLGFFLRCCEEAGGPSGSG